MTRHHSPTARSAARMGCGLALGALALGLVSPAMAEDYRPQPGQTPIQSSNNESFFGKTLDYIENNSYGRLGPLYFHYYGSSSELHVDNAQGLAAQAFGPGGSDLAHTGSSAGDKLTLGGTIGLYIPMTNHHLAVEVLLAPPLKLDFEVAKDAIDEPLAPTALNGANGETIPTGVPALGRTIGSFKALPPNFTIVYRPWTDTMIQPYIGAGAMYLYTYDTDVNNEVLNELGEPELYLSKPVACVGQLGADFNLPHNMFLNADVKYVGCAEVKARVSGIRINSPTLSPTFGPINVGSVSSTNDFRAVLYSISFGMHF
ncbi:OmpW/AlkL family protein [Salinisphaera sp.]|uniref:OmpW/AlkL family protein n=1 Tax=Salinisphaera sp. TaxID=1914330 RepID=UPI002D77AD03|nr:OmpW family outer membrane protein [Salinisphaera sp.]HET7315733.1 OmpW family outer membrane protein [Salinisphaera sp.]